MQCHDPFRYDSGSAVHLSKTGQYEKRQSVTTYLVVSGTGRNTCIDDAQVRGQQHMKRVNA